MQRLSPNEDPARRVDSPAARAPFQRELCATSLVARPPRLSRSERAELPARAPLAPLLESAGLEAVGLEVATLERRASSAARNTAERVPAERAPALAEPAVRAAPAAARA